MTTTPDHALAPPEGDDTFITEILARRRRRTPLLTLALVVILAAGGAFVAGAEAQKHYGHSTSSSSSSSSNGKVASALAAARASGATFGGLGGKGGGNLPSFVGGATTGTVTLIKGNTLYVTDSSGNTVLVHTSPRSAVTRSVAGTVKSVSPGDTVSVLGPQRKDGSYTARSISITGNG